MPRSREGLPGEAGARVGGALQSRQEFLLNVLPVRLGIPWRSGVRTFTARAGLPGRPGRGILQPRRCLCPWARVETAETVQLLSGPSHGT